MLIPTAAAQARRICQQIWLGEWIIAPLVCAFPWQSKSRRIENRLPGADANPYLAIAATLAAIWLGLEEKRRPSRPLKDSGEDLETLPKNLDIALDALEKASPLHDVLGEGFVKLFTEVKRAEADAFLEVISPWEREYLLLNV